MHKHMMDGRDSNQECTYGVKSKYKQRLHAQCTSALSNAILTVKQQTTQTNHFDSAEERGNAFVCLFVTFAHACLSKIP